MGTTADKLNYLNNTKGKLKTVINLMGTEIEDSDTFRSYTDKLQEQILKVIDGEVDLYDEYPKTTTTGTTASIQNTINNKMRIELNSTELTQDGTPTPDSPQDIRVITGDNSVNVIGKNLINFPYSETTKTVNGITFTVKNDGTIHVEGTASARAEFLIRGKDINLSITEGETYTLATSGLGTIDSTLWLDTYGQAGKFLDEWALSRTTTYTSAVAQSKDIKPILRIVVANSATVNTDVKVWLYKGSYDETTTYEPYHNQTYPINLGTIEVCKIGNYADQFFKNTTDSPYYDNTLIENEWYLKKNIGKIVLDGNESNVSVKNPGTSNWFYSFKDLNQNTPGEGNGYVLSNYYEANTIYTSNTNEGICVIRTSKEIRIRYGQEDTLSNFLNWVSNHNIEVYYVLATATYIYISQEDYPILKQELDNLYNNAKSYNGTTNITQTNDDLPFNLKIETLNDVEV